MVENLNYSVAGLLTVFPKYFSATTANMYGRTSCQPANQSGIANFAYNGRMGNRAGTNDGSDFRGRGAIQLTGRDNYTLFNQWLKANKYNYDVVAVTKLINGGSNGLAERTKLTNYYKGLII